jgi:predicted amidohydrolase
MRTFLMVLIGALAAQGQSATRSTADRLPRKVIVGTVILHSSRLPKDLEPRLAALGQLVDRVAAQSHQQFGRNPDLVVLPEIIVTPVEGVPFEGPVETAFAAMARRNHSYVVAPMIQIQDGRKFNAAILVDRQGKVAGIYHKLHIAVANGSDSLEDGTTPGQSVPVFETDFGKLGIQICFDMQYDYGWSELARQGADLVVWPTASPQTAHPAARAMQYGYYIVSSPWRNNASVFEPTGKITAQIRPPESILVQEIDLSYAILPWSEGLQNGAAMKARYGDKIGFHYYEDEDQGIFWSNDPRVSIGKMAREMGFAEAGAELERIRKLYRAAGVAAYR